MIQARSDEENRTQSQQDESNGPGHLAQQPIKPRQDPGLKNQRNHQMLHPWPIHARRSLDPLAHSVLYCGDNEICVKLLKSHSASLFQQRDARRVSQDRPFHVLYNAGDKILHMIGAGFTFPDGLFRRTEIVPLREH